MVVFKARLAFFNEQQFNLYLLELSAASEELTCPVFDAIITPNMRLDYNRNYGKLIFYKLSTHFTIKKLRAAERSRYLKRVPHFAKRCHTGKLISAYIVKTIVALSVVFFLWSVANLLSFDLGVFNFIYKITNLLVYDLVRCHLHIIIKS